VQLHPVVIFARQRKRLIWKYICSFLFLVFENIPYSNIPPHTWGGWNIGIGFGIYLEYAWNIILYILVFISFHNMPLEYFWNIVGIKNIPYLCFSETLE
jgi:hypothetical protein